MTSETLRAVPDVTDDDTALYTRFLRDANEGVYKFVADPIKKNALARQNLINLNERNEKILKSLQKIKREYEILRSELQKELFFRNLTVDKQKILGRNKLNEFLLKRKKLEQQHRISPIVCELDKLTNTNKCLFEECQKITAIFDLTKKQYKEIMVQTQKLFWEKVCEFSCVILKVKNSSD